MNCGRPVSDTRREVILGGRVTLTQPASGYRTAIDPVLLAAAVSARPGEDLLDLGCGVGGAALCVLARVPGTTATGIEIDESLAALARTNGAAMGLRVVLGDLRDHGILPGAAFAHVIANPPYHDAARHRASPNPVKARANGGSASDLAAWIAVAARRARPGGTVTLIQKADRLPEILSALPSSLGRVRAKPILPRTGDPAIRVIVQAVKGRRTPFALHAPLVLHEHDGTWTEAANAILRDAGALAW